MKKSRLIIFLTSLVSCCLCCFLYAKLMSWILPPVEPGPPAQTFSDDSFLATRPDEFRYLTNLFPPDDWRIRTANYLTSTQDGGILFFKESPIISPDKRQLTLKACTIVIPASGQTLSLEEKYQRAMILEADDQATLVFTQPLTSNFESFSFASFEKGELKEVVFRGILGEEGTDEFVLTTTSLIFTPKQIIANEQVIVEFQKRSNATVDQPPLPAPDAIKVPQIAFGSNPDAFFAEQTQRNRGVLQAKTEIAPETKRWTVGYGSTLPSLQTPPSSPPFSAVPSSAPTVPISAPPSSPESFRGGVFNDSTPPGSANTGSASPGSTNQDSANAQAPQRSRPGTKSFDLQELRAEGEGLVIEFSMPLITNSSEDFSDSDSEDISEGKSDPNSTETTFEETQMPQDLLEGIPDDAFVDPEDAAPVAPEDPILTDIEKGNTSCGVSIESINLDILKYVNFYFDWNQNKDSDRPSDEPQEGNVTSSGLKMVNIGCNRGVSFVPNPNNPAEWIVRFTENAHVTLSSPGTALEEDCLQCHNLYLYFTDPERQRHSDETNQFASYHFKNQPTGQLARLIPARIVAIGNEDLSKVNLDFKSSNFFVTADKLLYDFLQERILVQGNKSEQKVELVKDDVKVTAGALDYQLGKENPQTHQRDLGILYAGPGGQLETMIQNQNVPQYFRVLWKEGMRMVSLPEDSSQIRLSGTGGVEFFLDGVGTILANEVDFWGKLLKKTENDENLLAQPPSDSQSLPPETPEDSASLSQFEPLGAKFRGNTRLKTLRGEGVIRDEIAVRFSKPDEAFLSSSFTQNTPPTQTPEHSEIPPEKGTFFSEDSSLLGDQDNSSFALNANQLDLWLIWDGQKVANVSRLVIRGDVLFQENTLDHQEKTIQIQGEQVQIDSPNTKETLVLLVGRENRLASFQGRGLELIGNNLCINSQKNQFSVLGPGKLSFSPDFLAKDSPTPPFSSSQTGARVVPLAFNGACPSQNATSLHLRETHMSQGKGNVQLVPVAYSTQNLAQEVPQSPHTESNPPAVASAALQNSNSDASQPSGPPSTSPLADIFTQTPVTVTWSQQMSFDGTFLEFQAREADDVWVTQDKQRLISPKIRIKLRNPISIFDFKPDQIKSDNTIEWVECLGNANRPVHAEILLNSTASAQPGESVYLAEFKKFQFYYPSCDFIADGPGWIKGTMPTPPSKETSNQNAANPLSRPWTHFQMKFQKNIEGNVRQRQASANQDVNCVISTSDQRRSPLEIDSMMNQFPEDVIYLECDRITAVQKQENETGTNPLDGLEFAAEGNETNFRYNSIIIQCEKMTYSNLKKTVHFMGDHASIHDQKPGEKIRNLGNYSRASYNLDTNVLKVDKFSSTGE